MVILLISVTGFMCSFHLSSYVKNTNLFMYETHYTIKFRHFYDKFYYIYVSNTCQERRCLSSFLKVKETCRIYFCNIIFSKKIKLTLQSQSVSFIYIYYSSISSICFIYFVKVAADMPNLAAVSFLECFSPLTSFQI